MSKGLFVIGTGTDVGKTYVTGLLVKKLQQAGVRAAYYKAAMSGNEPRPDGSLHAGDAEAVQAVSGILQPVSSMCPYVYAHAYSPHLAARLEGGPVDPSVVLAGYQALEQKYDYITAEGSGGILCPIRWDEQKIWLEDLIRMLDLPCLLIADAGLGTINHVGLTAAYLKARQIPVQGLIFNRYRPGDVMHEDNVAMCRELTGLPVLALVPEGAQDLDIDTQLLCSLYQERTQKS